MPDYDNDRWNNDNRWAGEADHGQDRDRHRGYREGRWAEERDRDHERHRSHPLRGAPRVNQDIGYGSGSLATGVGAATRAPGSFSDYGASSSGGYGDGYGAYGSSIDRTSETRSFYSDDSDHGRRGARYPRTPYRADDRYDEGVGGAAFGAYEVLDRQARGDDRGMFGRPRDRDEGKHRGKGPKNYARSDERIRDDVNDRLTDDSWLNAQDIDVEVQDREVTLSGHVLSREDKRRAEVLAENVSGVNHVQNNLRVKTRDDDKADTGPLPML